MVRVAGRRHCGVFVVPTHHSTGAAMKFLAFLGHSILIGLALAGAVAFVWIWG
jgi:hypothetical protein